MSTPTTLTLALALGLAGCGSKSRAPEQPGIDEPPDVPGGDALPPAAPPPAAADATVAGTWSWFCGVAFGRSTCRWAEDTCNDAVEDDYDGADGDGAAPRCAAVGSVWCADWADGKELENPYFCWMTETECKAERRDARRCVQVRARRT